MHKINSNKDLKGLLTAMDQLTKDELAIELSPTCCPGEDVCDCEIPFCCAVNLPQGFKYLDSIDNEARFTIAKCCVTKLSCICSLESTVEICGQMVPVQNDVQVTKVFGCINFHVAVEGLLGDCGISLTSDGMGNWDTLGPLSPDLNKTFACCCGCICVDKIIDVEQPGPTISPCSDVTSELMCEEIILTEFEVVDEDCESVDPTLMPTPTPTPPFACNQILKISGKLRLSTGGDICP